MEAVNKPAGPPAGMWVQHPLPLRHRPHPTATRGSQRRRLHEPPALRARTRLRAPVAVVLAAHGRPARAHVGAAGRLQQHAQLRAVDVAAVHTAVGSGGSRGGGGSGESGDWERVGGVRGGAVWLDRGPEVEGAWSPSFHAKSHCCWCRCNLSVALIMCICTPEAASDGREVLDQECQYYGQCTASPFSAPVGYRR